MSHGAHVPSTRDTTAKHFFDEIGSKNVSDIECTDLLQQTFMPLWKFDGWLYQMDSFMMDPTLSLGIVTDGRLDLVSGSELEVNTLFGAQISIPYYTEIMEKHIREVNTNIAGFLKSYPHQSSNSSLLRIDEEMRVFYNTNFVLKDDVTHETDECDLLYDTDEDMIVITIKKNKNLCIETQLSVIIRCDLENLDELRISGHVVCLEIHAKVGFLSVIAEKIITLSRSLQSDDTCLRGNVIELEKDMNSKRFVAVSKELHTNGTVKISEVASIQITEKFIVNSTISFNLLNLHTEYFELKKNGSIESQHAWLKTSECCLRGIFRSSDAFFESKNLKTMKGSCLECSSKLVLYLLTDNGKNAMSNGGIIRAYDFVLQNLPNSPDSSHPLKMVSLGSIFVKNSFLMGHGNLECKGSLMIRSLYIISGGSVRSFDQSIYSVGDFMAVESGATLKIENEIKQYSYLKPLVFNSGTMCLSNKNTFYCKSFVSNGSILSSLDLNSDDKVSFSGLFDGPKMKLTGEEVVFSKMAIIKSHDVEISCAFFSALSKNVFITGKYNVECNDYAVVSDLKPIVAVRKRISSKTDSAKEEWLQITTPVKKSL